VRGSRGAREARFVKGIYASFWTLQAGLIEGFRREPGLCDWGFSGLGHPVGFYADGYVHFVIPLRPLLPLVLRSVLLCSPTTIRFIGAYLRLASLSPRLDEQRRARVVAFADGFYKTHYSHLCLITNRLDSNQRSLAVFHARKATMASVRKRSFWCDCGDIPLCSRTRAMIRTASGC